VLWKDFVSLFSRLALMLFASLEITKGVDLVVKAFGLEAVFSSP
jgi:hypothetical protein